MTIGQPPPTPDVPWRVSFVPVADSRVVRLHTGSATIVLPALEAHKLGSALRIASGIDTDAEEQEGKLCMAVRMYLLALTTAPGTPASQLALDQMATRAGWPTTAAGIGDGPRDPDLGQHEFAHPDIEHTDHQHERPMCTSGDHGDVPAVGDAWGGDEDRPEQRAPYCAECLTVLGADYGAFWWRPVAGGDQS